MKVKKITELNRIDIDQYKQSPKNKLIVVLDNVRSLNNIGSVFRSSDAFRIEAVYLCGITAVPPNAEIHKTALGAEFSVEWRYFSDTCAAVVELKQQGYRVCAIEQATDSILLNELNIDQDQHYALILGNEVKGVSQDVVDLCDCCIEIPQYGTKHSLNVSVANGIILWEFIRQMSR